MNIHQNVTNNQCNYYKSYQKPDNVNNGNIAFKNKLGDWIGKMYGKHYAEPMYNKRWVHSSSDKLSKIKGNMTEHMSALGSLLTSGVYMQRTLSNKDLDPQKRKTLAVNQGLCFVIPTFCAYYVNNKLKDLNKKYEYRYSGLQEQKKAMGKLSPEKAAELEAKLGSRLKGFKTFASLLTFTLIYRYATPVIVTPIANWLGRQFFGEDDSKKNLNVISQKIKNTTDEPKTELRVSD